MAQAVAKSDTEQTEHARHTEPTLDDLHESVIRAQEAILATAEERPGEWFDPEELRSRARNGSDADVMMFALTDLVNQGQLELGKDLRVRRQT